MENDEDNYNVEFFEENVVSESSLEYDSLEDSSSSSKNSVDENSDCLWELYNFTTGNMEFFQSFMMIN